MVPCTTGSAATLRVSFNVASFDLLLKPLAFENPTAYPDA